MPPWPSTRDSAVDISSGVSPCGQKRNNYEGGDISRSMVNGEPSSRLGGATHHVSGPLTSLALVWASNLFRDCLLLHLVLQEANPLRQRGGLDLGMNQELHAIFDLLFPHVQVLGQYWRHLSPSTTAVLRDVGGGGQHWVFFCLRVSNCVPESRTNIQNITPT